MKCEYRTRAVTSDIEISIVPPLLRYILTHSLTLWCRIFFEKLIAAQLVKQQPAFFMEPESLLEFSQNPATRPYPEPDESSSPYRCLSP
jgi:hypothetical protein